MTTRTATRTTTKTRTRTISARLGLTLSLALLVLAGGLRSAQAAPKRLGVVTFRGPGEGATRNVVMRAGKGHKYQIVGGQQISKAASKLKVKLDNNDSFQAVAKELGISAFVTGEVSKKKATLTVRNGMDGSVTAEASWTGPNPRKLSAAVNKTFWRRLGSAIARAKPPTGGKAAAPPVVAEETAPETGADDGDDDKGKGKAGGKKVAAADADSGSGADSDDKAKKSSSQSGDEADGENVISSKPDSDEEGAGAPGMEALIVSVGPRALNRGFTYNQSTDPRINRNYKVGVAPELSLNLDVFPAAFAKGASGFITNVGLTASLGYMLPVVTTPADPPATGTYKTYALDWVVGVKVRLPFNTFAMVGYGDQRYQLVKPTTASPEIVPMIDYRFVKIGVGGRIPVTPVLTVMANLAYLHMLSFGQIASASYFPHTKGMGVEVGAGIGYRLTPMFEIQGGVDLRRYGLSFNPTAADFAAGRPIAGGAVDQYISGWVGVAVVLGGSQGGSHAASSSAAEEEAAPEKSDDEGKAKDEEAEDEKSDEKSEEKSDEKSSKKKKGLEEDL